MLSLSTTLCPGNSDIAQNEIHAPLMTCALPDANHVVEPSFQTDVTEAA